MRLIIVGSAILILLIVGLLGYALFFVQSATEGLVSEDSSLIDPFGSVQENNTTGGIGLSNIGSSGEEQETAEPVFELNGVTKKILAQIQEVEMPHPTDSGTYFVPAEAKHATSSAYSIFVYEEGSVYVRLEEQPIGKTRRLAERFILDYFGLSEADACTLYYAVIVTAGVDEMYEDQNLGFSFCEGSVTLREI